MVPLATSGVVLVSRLSPRNRGGANDARRTAIMATMKTSNRWLSLYLGAVAVTFSASVLASTSSTDCIPDYFGDGACNSNNNIPECGYDGGDCCECTCTDGDYKCGMGPGSGFVCVDPDAPCVNDDNITVDMLEACYWVGVVGNGFCDEENNNAACNYDGGDCCECTCDPSNPMFDDDGACSPTASCACIDPDAPCVNDDSVTVDMIDLCEAQDIGNGRCDTENNIPECLYDGGDCCECTCGPFPDNQWACEGLYSCVDPSASCVNDDDITVDMLENCRFGLGVETVGDGVCDIKMNIPECNYDGGDCCECTCELGPFADDESATRYDGCYEFACIDPDAPCVDDDLVTIETIENCDYVTGIGNGECDDKNNNELCLYDGGDCCSCTCETSWDDGWTCIADRSGFDCKDPNAPCFGEENTKNYEDDDASAGGPDDDTTTTTTETDIDTDDDEGDGGDGDEDDDDYSMSFDFVPWEQEEPLPTVEGAVEVGDKIEIGVTATGYDVRPGRSSGLVGCGEEGGDGCAPANSRDGIASEVESRWSCASKIVEGGGPCQIVYTFAEPQDIVDIQVAFWKGNERIRTLDVYLDGEKDQTHGSYYSGSAYNTLGVDANDVTTVMLESTGLAADEWISLIEVLIFVKPDQEPLPTVEGAVEVGDITEVGVMTTANDVRPGRSSGMVGCGVEGGDGCNGSLTRDAITNDIESRWACATKLLEGGGPCQIEYTFAEPQDIVEIQVAFRKANERIRTLEVYLDGVAALTHESYAGSTFNTLGVSASGVSTVTLESVGLLADEWISLIEVLIFVTP